MITIILDAISGIVFGSVVTVALAVRGQSRTIRRLIGERLDLNHVEFKAGFDAGLDYVRNMNQEALDYLRSPDFKQ